MRALGAVLAAILAVAASVVFMLVAIAWITVLPFLGLFWLLGWLA
ncbi:hypothetical protein [Mesorhizobium sp.]|nr:hypothetical protein [Mesorhizobium sp.]